MQPAFIEYFLVKRICVQGLSRSGIFVRCLGLHSRTLLSYHVCALYAVSMQQCARCSRVPWHNNDRASCSPNIIRVRLGRIAVRRIPRPMNSTSTVSSLYKLAACERRLYVCLGMTYVAYPLLGNHHVNVLHLSPLRTCFVGSTPLDWRQLNIIFQFICFRIRCFWHIIIPSKVFHSIRPESGHTTTYGFSYHNDLSATLNTYIFAAWRPKLVHHREFDAIPNFETANIDTVSTRL